MKKFDNVSEDNKEKAFRRGFTVPPGGVNVAWAQSPSMSPKNNTIIIDTSRVSGDNANISTKTQKVAYSNYLGILEDKDGNQVWDEEYPIVSDVFLPPVGTGKYGDDLRDEDILPYVHVSRFFHVDFVGLAMGGQPTEYTSAELKVVDKNGTHFTYPDGTRKYKTYLVSVNADSQLGTRDAIYRVYVFLDMNPQANELYLTYNKVELASNGSLRNQQIDYKEQINPRPYFNYVPEESDTLDQTFSKEKIFSTKPINLKQKALNLPQNDYQGWKIHVPRKAIADPRIFQLFRWRLACEYTQPVAPQYPQSDEYSTASTIKAGVIVPRGGNHMHTRANYFFYQLNTSDYNFSKTKFINPLKSINNSYIESNARAASYWHVDIDAVSQEDLGKFDILIWAPTTPTLSIAAYRAKIDHFVDNQGGTFILETSSFVGNGTGLSGFTFSPRMDVPTGSAVTDVVTADSLRIYDATADNPNDEFSSYGMWKEWPPNVRDIITNYTDTGSILADAAPIAGWNLTNNEKIGLSPYDEIAPQVMRFQYITQFPNDFKKVLEARKDSSSPYYPTLVHKKYNSGGNFFVSTGCIFEDHLFEPSGDMIMRTMQLASWNDLPNNWKINWDPITSSNIAAAEYKFRYNVMMLSTVFRPSPKSDTTTSQIVRNNDRQSTTIYSDWYSSWVINPEDGVLTDKEIDEFDFVLQSTSPLDLAPTWQRILSNKSAKQIITEKLASLETTQGGLTASLQGAAKRYFVIVTNPEVQVPTSTLITDDSILTAWTKAYSPPFTVPYYLGPYKIRDEMIAGTGVGDGRRIYPPKQWAARSKVTYLKSSGETGQVTARLRMTATVKRLLRVKDNLAWRRVWIPGVNQTVYRAHDTVLRWSTNGIPGYGVDGGRTHQSGIPVPHYHTIDTWADAHYYNYATSNWPFWGRSNTLSVNSPYGKVWGAQDVLGVQKMMNQSVYWGLMPGPYIAEDGVFRNQTADAVYRFQVYRQAWYKDGIVDAETFSLIGFLLRWLRGIPGWYDAADPLLRAWSDEAEFFLRIENISDGYAGNAYGRASWFTNGPAEIGQLMQIIFDPGNAYADGEGKFRIFGIRILPWQWARLCYLDITSRPYWQGLHGYVWNGWPGNVGFGLHGDSHWIDCWLPEARGTGVIFQINSTEPIRAPDGWVFGSSRILGIRDVEVYARRDFPEIITTPGYWQDQQYDPGTYHTVEDTDTVTYDATITFRAGIRTTLNPLTALSQQIASIMADVPAGTLQSATVTDIRWNVNSVEFPNDPTLADFFDVSFRDFSAPNQTRNEAYFDFNGYGLTVSPDSFAQSAMYGKGDVQYYTRTEGGAVNPYPQRFGWVTKEEGIKLLCTAAGRPTGFPYSIPNLVGENIHYANYILEVDDTDQSTYVGFYDNNRKEWVTNGAGEPVMSYYDYVRRGPNNVFIGAMTTYELDITGNLPGSTQSIQRPFKWAMPVYGVTTGASAKIQIAPINPDLGSTDVWPIPIKTGTFSRAVPLKPKSQGSYTNWLSDYQGSTVYAYYNIPEAEEGPWSKLYGRPYVDVENEQPIIIDDNAIQVRQYPILTVQEPTAIPSLADPWKPVFKVWIRQSLGSAWVAQEMSDIRDYDLIRGTITLKENLPSNDPRLVKVDYTSENKVYSFKFDGTNRINLNPYINGMPDWNDKPLYVYIVPEYVADKDYKLIPDTSERRTLRVTTDPSIFSPSQVNYDPLAIMLGMVYITTSFDINDLSILDTRRRGGGVSTAYSDEEIALIEPESENYWDVTPRGATSYQKGGFVIIRFPAEIVNHCTEQQVINAIERNITLGVRYKIEALDGSPIEWPKELAAE